MFVMDYFEFKKPDSIDKEDETEQKVAQQRAEEKRPPVPGILTGSLN